MNEFLHVLWQYLEASAPFLLLGFIASGVIHQYIPESKLKKLIGTGKARDVFVASFIGVPLPLCSCSVIPMATSLRKSGASNAATSSFLISTPESGIDSIAMSYSLLDLPMAIFRPVAAFSSAFVAGYLNLFFNKFEPVNEVSKEADHCCHPGDHDHSHGSSAPKNDSALKKIFRYGFVDLLDDMVNWLVVGLILGSVITFVVPDDFFSQSNDSLNRFLVLLVGVPLYICASASTPVAASLILKGISPGTAILFLLVGPATNISNISILQKYIGMKGVLLNLLAIIGVALLFSYGVDWFYQSFELKMRFTESMAHDHGNLFYTVCAVVLVGLILQSLWRVNKGKFIK